MPDLLVLVLLCLALYVPGLTTLPPVDRDESLYVLATRQMLARGDLIVPRVGDQPRLIKPIGIYWAQALSVQLMQNLSGAALLGHRLPSLLGALVAVLETYLIGRCLFAGAVPVLAAALLAAAALVVVEAHLATTDAALLACIVAAQGSLAGLFKSVRRPRRGSWWLAASFWLTIGAGVLIKGPVAPLVSGLTVVALVLAGSSVRRAEGRRLIAALRPWWGIPLAAACIVPWLIALATRLGWQALPQAMAADILPKLGGVHESHGGPPGTYLLFAPATFWPGSLLLVFALTHAWRRRRRPAERFLIAWLLPSWLFFECVPTKLPHYALPMFPALALLAARAALGATSRLRPLPQRRLVRVGFVGWALIGAALSGGVVAAAWYLEAAAQVCVWAGIAAMVGVSTSAASLHWCWRRRFGRAALAGVAGAMAFYAVLLQVVLPGLDALWLSRRAVSAVARLNDPRALVALGFTEPSLAVLAPTEVYFAAAADAALTAMTQTDGLGLVSDEQMSDFSAAAAQRGLPLRHRASVAGLDYTHGRWQTLHLLTVQR